VGWYCYNSINGTTGDTYPSSGEQGYGTHQVGKKEANRLGLYDMSGNVDEWCYDWPETVNTGEESDPTGASSGSVRVSRGGGWVDSANFKSVAFRGCGNPSTRYNYYGFRVVRTSTEVIENLAHTHKFAEEWTKDETNHWHAAICEHTTEVSEKAEHSFVNEVCTICEYSRIPEGFVLVEGTTITGTESWTPESEVFVSKRKLTIPNLIVSDHEVTRGEYLEVMEIDPSTAKAYNKNGTELTGEDVLNTPVNEVKWYAALVYCNKRSIDEGFTPCYTIKGSTDPDAWGEVPTQSYDIWNAATCDFNANGYRLPTNAEWEWLARGGENYLCAGSDILDEVAWYTDNTNGTREVKTKAPNGYGLYDMNGNVSEWCWDWYRIISDSTPADGVASGTYRVFRGGGWNSDDSCQVTSSGNHYPHYHYDFYGFRVVRTVTD
ncbi:MAG: SUMF1/EgtB/PvdO family nonheme iron enzyme, partial [Lachnospiraceae bacterium]|nr:SUMF1/EgtB/PvdO family nonheme iron enzyme [Lachnospiraceae bacterium]